MKKNNLEKFRKLLVQEAFIKYFDNLDKFKTLRTYIQGMSYEELMKLTQKNDSNGLQPFEEGKQPVNEVLGTVALGLGATALAAGGAIAGGIYGTKKIMGDSSFTTLKSLIGLVFFTPLWVALRGIRLASSACQRQCGAISIETPKRQACLVRCKLIQQEKGLALARQAQSRCNESKDPERCFEVAEKAIREIQQTISELKLRLSKIERNS